MGAAVAVACKFPVVVGTVAAGAVVGPSGICYVLAAAADIAVVVVVGSAVAASVDATAAWGIGGSGVVVAVDASRVVPSAAVISMPLACLIQIFLSPFVLSLSIPGLLPSHLVGFCVAPSYTHPRTCVIRLFSLVGGGHIFDSWWGSCTHHGRRRIHMRSSRVSSCYA